MRGGAVSASPLGLPMTLRELPQSTSIIGQRQMREQNIRTLDDALVQANGVSRQIYGSNRAGYNYLFARGSRITNFSIDGLNAGDSLQDAGNAATAAYERVEVVRGANGLLYGAGEPSASVNLVRKRPTRTPQAQIALHAGSYRQNGASADVSGSLNDAGTLRGRAVADFHHGRTWREREKSRDFSLYGIAEYDVTPATRLHAGAHYQQARETAASSHSTVTYDNAGYATPLGVHYNPSADWAYSRTRTLNLFAGVQHQFRNGVQGKVEYSYTKRDWDHPYGVAGILGINHNTGAADMITGYWRDRPHTHSLNASLNGSYRLFGREHDWTAGIGGSRSKSSRHGARNIAFNAVANLDDFSRSRSYPEPAS